MRKIVLVVFIYLLFGFLYTLSRPVLGGCDAEKPDHAPDLFKIDVTKNSATLYFTPVNNAVTNYWIAYGLNRGEDRYGVAYPLRHYDGVISYTVNYLAPNTRYYFRVKAVNGCRQGFWSDTMSVETNWESKIYTRFKEELIRGSNPTFGKNALKEITSLSKLIPQPLPTTTPVSTPVLSPTVTVVNAGQVKGVTTKNLSKYILPVILLILLIPLILYFYKKRKNNSS